MPASGTVAELWRFPVKSMAGEPVEAVEVDWRGAGGDRTHALHEVRKGRRQALTVRQAPGMLRWSATYAGAGVAPADPPVPALTAPDGRAFGWEDPALPGALAEDLGRPVELVRDLDGQQDLGRSLLVTTEASRRALEAELGEPVDGRRFRPNLHLDLDAPAWAELEWPGGRLELEGGVVLELLHPCVRCVVPTRWADATGRWAAGPGCSSTWPASTRPASASTPA
jgi:uncharacterized protein YcbX